MKIVVFGATGMVGQGVLRECLLDPGVDAVVAIGRRATGQTHPKLRELVREDLTDFGPVQHELAGFDACFFCLGVSSAGMREADYRRVTYDIALAAGRALLAANPGIVFVFVSGASTDAKGRAMWARVKGETENALLALPFRAVFVFRPAFIEPLHGITSRTALYRALYLVLRPLVPLVKALFPRYVTTTETMGKAMLHVARYGAPRRILETADINALVASPS
jgi:uncharacterized protein YbjT (DUF2867 family)